MVKKVLVSGVLITSLLSFGTLNTVMAADVEGGYEEIDCSSDSVFSDNSCNQCFTGGEKTVGGYIGLLDDTWINSTDYDQIMYREQQSDPKMVNLNPSLVEWEQTPSGDGFWQMTSDLESLNNDELGGFLLPKGESVRRIETKVGSAYKLAKNEAATGENIGLIVFPIVAHNVLEDGEITTESEEHHECVLIKSGEKTEKPVVETPKKLPETGPVQFVILLVLAMVLAFGVLRFRKS